MTNKTFQTFQTLLTNSTNKQMNSIQKLENPADSSFFQQHRGSAGRSATFL